MKRLPTIWTDLLNLVYPPTCLLCHQPLTTHEQHLCLHCLSSLNRYREITEGKGTLQELFAGYPCIEEMDAYLRYEKDGKTQTLIHALKYYDNRELAYYLGQLFARNTKKFQDIDTIIPVPLHPKRLRERGYNQSEQIAKGFASVRQLPIYTNNLIKTQHTPSQTTKTVYERQATLPELYRVIDPIPLKNKHILLIDDVATSGNTLRQCIEALQTIPGLRISLAPLSVAGKGTETTIDLKI